MAPRVRAVVGGISRRARSVTEDVFEARYSNQSGRVQECVGLVTPKRARWDASRSELCGILPRDAHHALAIRPIGQAVDAVLAKAVGHLQIGHVDRGYVTQLEVVQVVLRLL